MTVLAPSASSARCDPASFTIGLLPELPGIPVERSIRAALMDLANTAVRNGIRVDLIDPPMDSREQHRAWVDMHAAASKFGSSWETRHPTAASKRLRARAAWGASLARHGVILMPAAMCVAFAHRPTGAPIDVDGTPVPYWRLGRYTEPLNLIGLPAIVFPIGMDGAGLPIAAQLVGANGQDSWLVASARWLASLVAELPVPT